MNGRLYRSRTDRMIGGVAAGIADYINADPALVRIGWAILVVITGGVALVAYIVAWIVVPEAPAGEPVAGAYVRLLDRTGEFTAEVPTSASGAFRFFAAGGSWTVRALAPGAATVDRRVVASLGEVADLEVEV